MKFTVIVADPAWSFSDKLTMADTPRGADANYQGVMTVENIKNLPVKFLVDPEGSILCLWAPSSMLDIGLEVMKSWGFKQKQIYVWGKIKKEPFQKIKKSLRKKIHKLFSDNKSTKKKINTSELMKIINQELDGFNYNILDFGMGRLFRQTHEICLIGTHSNKIYKKLRNKSQRSVELARNLGHSSKPEGLYESLEIMFPGQKMVELFARRQRPGWLCLGNEAPMSVGEDIRSSLIKLIMLNDKQYNEFISSKDEQGLADNWKNLLIDKNVEIIEDDFGSTTAIKCTKNEKLHREDGPAVEFTDGEKWWYVNGKRHRLDGPAHEYADGAKEWYYQGQKINCNSQEEFERIINLLSFG